MSPQGHQSLGGESDDYYSVMTNAATLNSSVPSAIRQSWGTESLTSYQGRMGQPNRLSLDSFRILPSMNEHLLPGEPRSPGEYINIDFSEGTKYSLPSASNESQESSLGSSGGQPRFPLSDYMNLHHIVSQSPKAGDTPAGRLDTVPESSLCPCLDGEGVYHLRSKRDSKCPQRGKDEYTEMTFGLGMANIPHQFVPQTSARYTQD